MSVIVKGIFGKEMPMPQEGYVDIRLHFKGGRIECATMPTGNPPYYATFKVAELPPHGRLIDADKLEKGFKRAIGTYLPKDPTRHMDIVHGSECRGWTYALMAVQEAKTVIKAED